MFKSSLANEMSAFLELRCMSVCKQTVIADKCALNTLDQYLIDCGFHGTELPQDLLEAWILTLSGKSKTVKEKVGTIRNFIKYLNSLGNCSFLPTPPKVKSDYIPYIYSDEELLTIIHFADNLTPLRPNQCSPYLLLKIPMVIRILYGCGTRLAETMALQRKDVDFKAGTIFLRKTKFSKERLIPVHESLINILERYCLTLGIMHKLEAYLFPSRAPSRHLTERQMETWFSEILKLANIDQRDKKSGERGACLHCFRHLFVLRSMQQLEAAGRPVDMNDLLLPTYLGHECLIDTDKYMRFSGVQVPESLDAFESFTAGLIPKVEVPYEEE